MAEPPPVVIEREGAHYRVVRDGELLFRVPGGVFESYQADAVFPPLWTPAAGPEPLRRLLWQPRSKELLMGGPESQPAGLAEVFGNSAFRAYLHGLWIPTPPTVYLRPFWHPGDPYEPFDLRARRASYEVQRGFLSLLASLRPPAGWCAVLNAVEPVLESLMGAAEEDPLRELSLTPPGQLADPRVRGALETLALEQVGGCAPVLRDGTLLVGVWAPSLRDQQAAEAALAEAGLLCQEGPYRPH